MFTLRFDMRAPAWGAPIEDLYAAAIEMAAWAEDRGAIVAVLSEHHRTDDRHLPSPLVLASAMAARTERLAIMVAAAVLPFYDPVRLAEDMAVLDIISRGRVSYVLGIGHREEEYDLFGIDRRRRGAIGRRAPRARCSSYCDGDRITPGPTSGGPQLFFGGGSLAAARRAGRFGLGLIAQAGDAGHAGGLRGGLPRGRARARLRPDPRARAHHGPLRRRRRRPGVGRARSAPPARRHDRGLVPPRPDGRRQHQHRHAPSTSSVPSTTYRVVTVDEAADIVRAGTILPLLPLCGGLAPEVAWPYLERAAEAAARGGANAHDASNAPGSRCGPPVGSDPTPSGPSPAVPTSTWSACGSTRPRRSAVMPASSPASSRSASSPPTTSPRSSPSAPTA